LPVQEISWLSSWATGGLKPDLVVLLDVDPTVGLGRVDKRGLGADRLESESRSFHERVRYAFLDLASADPKRYLVLDAARPADEIAGAVATRLNAMLTEGDDSHPDPASTAVPPGPDLNAPDLADTMVVPPHAGPDETLVMRTASGAVATSGSDETIVVRPASSAGPDDTMVIRPGTGPDDTMVVSSSSPDATMALPSDATMALPRSAPDDPNATVMVSRPASDDPNATVVVRQPDPDDPNVTMAVPAGGSDETVIVRPASSGNESDETMVVRDAGAVSATKSADADADAEDDEDEDEEDETAIEVLEDLTGNRARAADDETPPQVGSKP
jgi:dTMP kinase